MTKKTETTQSNGTAEKVAESGITRSHDLPWHAKKVAIFKALKKLGAIGKGSAVSADAIAAEAKVTNRDVRHYCYHAMCSGLTGVYSESEAFRGYGFYLTAKGAKVDPVAALKAQEAAREKPKATVTKTKKATKETVEA